MAENATEPNDTLYDDWEFPLVVRFDTSHGGFVLETAFSSGISIFELEGNSARHYEALKEALNEYLARGELYREIATSSNASMPEEDGLQEHILKCIIHQNIIVDQQRHGIPVLQAKGTSLRILLDESGQQLLEQYIALLHQAGFENKASRIQKVLLRIKSLMPPWEDLIRQKQRLEEARLAGPDLRNINARMVSFEPFFNDDTDKLSGFYLAHNGQDNFTFTGIRSLLEALTVEPTLSERDRSNTTQAVKSLFPTEEGPGRERTILQHRDSSIMIYHDTIEATQEDPHIELSDYTIILGVTNGCLRIDTITPLTEELIRGYSREISAEHPGVGCVILAALEGRSAYEAAKEECRTDLKTLTPKRGEGISSNPHALPKRHR